MNLDDFDLNLFVVFERIYSEGSLTRAAKSLRVTQPAISNSLRRLRQRFDDPLFVRNASGMVPTPLTETIIPKVRQALQSLGHCLQQQETFDPDTTERTFNIAMTDMSEALYLPNIIRQLQQSQARVRVQSVRIQQDQIAAALASGAIDLAMERAELKDARLLSRTLMDDHYVVALRKGHPLADRHITLNDYLDLTHVHLCSHNQGMDLIDHALKNLGYSRKLGLQAQHYSLAPAILAHSDMALTLPSRLARDMDLVIKPLPFDIPRLKLQLFWHKRAENDHANQWLRERVAS